MVPTFAPEPSRPPSSAKFGPLDALHDHRVSFRAETWFLPNSGSVPGYGWTNPTWAIASGYWIGDNGLTSQLTIFSTVYAAFRPQPYFAKNTPMLDLAVRHHFESGNFQLGLGYRSLGIADVNFVTALGLVRRPLPGGRIWLEGLALGGLDPKGRAILDFEGRLTYRIVSFSADLGFRQMIIASSREPLFSINGPTAGLTYRF